MSKSIVELPNYIKVPTSLGQDCSWETTTYWDWVFGHIERMMRGTDIKIDMDSFHCDKSKMKCFLEYLGHRCGLRILFKENNFKFEIFMKGGEMKISNCHRGELVFPLKCPNIVNGITEYVNNFVEQ